MTTLTTYSLRLPKSIKEAAERLSKADGTSLNQFVAIAVAEKIAALKAAEFFEEKRRQATPGALDALLSRSGGEPPRQGDELPEGYVPLSVREAAAQPQPAKPRPARPKGRVAEAQATPPAAKARRAAKAKP